MTTLREAAQQALEALEYRDGDGADQWKADVITALRAALAQEQAEPVAWLQPRTIDGHLRPDLGYEACSSADYGAFPVYRVPPKRQPLSGLEVERLLEQVIGSLPAARNLVRAVERAHGIIEPQIKVDSHQTLDDAMRLPRAMAQAYENGYKAGVAAEREACAQACEARFMGDMTREDMEARRCAAAIRARGNT